MGDADSHGYITDTEYADTCFQELSPAWINYAAALGGAAAPSLDRPFVYVELGCGRGHSTIVHAGAFPQAQFYGCDLNAAQIGEGVRYAQHCGIENVTLWPASFDELTLLRPPAADYIALHGVYSWVTADVRRTIRQLIADTLKPGGLVYLSYNCLPGWSSELPLRKLLVELAGHGSGDSAGRGEQAVRALEALQASGLRYFKANPAAAEAVEAYARGSGEYLAHEFLNAAWEPFYSVDVAGDMAAIGLTFVGSATLADNHQVLTVDDRPARAVAALPSPRLQQLALDFATNRRFRRDVFVKGAAPAPAIEPLLATFVSCAGDPANLGPAARVPRGEIRFQEDFVNDLRPLLTRRPVAIGDLLDRLHRPGRNADEILRNLTLLVAAGSLIPCARGDNRPAATLFSGMSTLTERILSFVNEHQVTRTIPSEVTGHGLRLEPANARAIRDWQTRGCQDPAPDIVRQMLRLGLIV